MDIFLSLAETDASIRQGAVATLIEELQARVINDRKESAKTDIPVKKTADGLELPLYYAVDRLVKGLGSSRLCARQGFAAALTSVLLNFEYIPTDVLVKISKDRAALASSYTGFEKRDYEVGVAFLFLTFAQSKRVQQLPTDYIKTQFTVLHGLQKSSPQMGELVSNALTSTANNMSDSQLTSIFIPAALSVLPSSFSEMKPHELLMALQVHKIFVQSPQLFVDRAKPAYIANMLAPSNFGGIFGVLEKTLPTYPSIHSAWGAIFSILAHETVVTEKTVKFHASVQSAVGKQSAFARFWQDVVHNMIATQYSFHKKSYALALMDLALETLFAIPAPDATAHHQWFAQHLSHIFLPDYTKLFMTHLKEVTAPAHADAAKIMNTLKRIGEAAQPVAIAIISTLSSPEHGGHRQFDIKTHNSLLKSLQKSLDDEGTTLYMNTLYDTFQNAEVLAQKDVRAAAEATKDHENSLRDQIATSKAAGDDAAVEEQQAQLDAFISNGIGNVEEFLEGAAAQEAIKNSCETLRLWVIDQLVDMCKNARLMATTLEKRMNVDKSKNADANARVERCLLFVFRQAFFTAPAAPKPKKGKKTTKASGSADFVADNSIIEVTEKVRRGCVVGYIALLSSLLNDAYANVGKKRVSGSEMDHMGAVWCDRVMQYWTDLESNGYTMGDDFTKSSREAYETAVELLKFLRAQIEATSPTKKQPFTTRDPRRMQLVRLRSMNLLAVHIAALLPTDPVDFSTVLVDLHQVAARAFAGDDDMEDDENNWIEVLIDLLMSLLAKPSALLRSLCFKVFSSFSSDLNAAAVDDILRVVTNTKQEEEVDVESNADDADEDEDEDDESDDDVVEYKDGRWDPMSGRVDDDESAEKEDAEEEEELDFGAALREDANTLDMNDITEMLMNPAFQSANDGSQTAEDKALQDLVKMKKNRNTEKRDVQRETMHFRLRVIDLVELLMKKHPNSALMLRFYDPLLVALQSAVGADMRTFNDRISAMYTSKLCRPYPVSDLPAMPDFLDANNVAVSTDDEAAAEDALNAPVADASMIKEVLDNRFRSAKMPLGSQVLALEAKAITRLINQFLSAPPDTKEWNDVASTISPMSPTPVAKPKRGKKAAAETAQTGVDKTAVLTEIRALRAKYVSEKVLTLLVMFAFNKRSTMTPKFFTDIISKSALAMWHTPIVSCLSKTILNAPSTYVRTEALHIISALLKNKQCIKSPAELLSLLDILRGTLSEAYTKGVDALKVVADAVYVKGVKSEAEKQIKVEITAMAKGGKKNQQKGVKVGGAKVQKTYMTTLTHLYQQFVVIYRQTEKLLGKTPSLEMPKKVKVKVKPEKKEKKENKEDTVKEEVVADEDVVEIPAKKAKLLPTVETSAKVKKSKRSSDDGEEKSVKKSKKAKTSS